MTFRRVEGITEWGSCFKSAVMGESLRTMWKRTRLKRRCSCIARRIQKSRVRTTSMGKDNEKKKTRKEKKTRKHSINNCLY
jgi:hypothetical protein